MLDPCVHVFVEIVAADDRVDFELDVVLPAQLAEIDERLQVGAFAAADQHVGVFVEGIARDGHDVEVFGVGLEPLLFDEAAVGDDGDGFQVKVFFAVPCVVRVVSLRCLHGVLEGSL